MGITNNKKETHPVKIIVIVVLILHGNQSCMLHHISRVAFREIVY